MMRASPSALLRQLLVALPLTLPAMTVAAQADNARPGMQNLSSVYRSALTNDPDYQAALDNFRAAAEAEPQALAALLPELQARGSYNRVRQSIDGDFFSISEIDETDIFDRSAYGATLRQPLFRFDAFLGLDRSELEVGRARLLLTDERHALMLSAAQRYFALLAAKDERELVLAEESAIRRQVEQTEGSFDAGLIAETDLKAVQAQLDRVRARKITVENRIEVVRSRLETLIGEPVNEMARFPSDPQLPDMEHEQLDAWLERAMQHNLDLLSETVRLKLAEMDTRIAQSGHYPTLDLVGSYTYFDADGGFEGAREDHDARIGVTLSVPIFQGGMTASRVRQARARASAVAHTVDGARQQARLNTREAFLNAKAARARAEALKRVVESTRSAEESAQVAFDVGSRTAADYLTAVRERFRAERDLSQARYDYILDLLRLRRAAGVMTVADLEDLNRSLR